MSTHFLTIADLSKQIASRTISPVEVTQEMLDRISKIDSSIKSYVLVTADLAIAQAQQAEAEISSGIVKGPLHGVPIAVKDLFSTKGVTTAAGMPLHKDFVPKNDATVVRRLREAGAILLGKLKTTEGAHAQHRPPLFEAPINPWNADLWAGASSSGSGAATSSGLCFAALGTETGGSIRLPAAATGATALKPTWGRVSRYGVFELAAMLDHVGPFARSAADIGIVLSAIAGQDVNDPTASLEPVPNYAANLPTGLRGVRIGLDRHFALNGVDDKTSEAFEAVLNVMSSLGASIVDIKVPDTRKMIEAYLPLSGVQTAVAHKETFPSRRDEYGQLLAAVIDLGRTVSGMEYHELLLQQMEFRGQMHRALNDVDVIISPVLTHGIPTAAQMDVMSDEIIEGIIRFTGPFCLSGHPVIVLPCGFTTKHGPICFQLVAANFREKTLIETAHAYQLMTDWHNRHPAL